MTVVTKSDGDNRQVVPTQYLQLLPRLNIPNPYSILFRAADNTSLSKRSEISRVIDIATTRG